MKIFLSITWFIIYTMMLGFLQLVLIIVGIIFLPLVLTRVEAFDCLAIDSRPSVKFKDSWIDKIFGNTDDGLDGDTPYKSRKGINWWFDRYNWVALRNPIHNLALSMGVNEKIVSYVWLGNKYTEDRIGKEGFVYSEATGESGKVYPMYRWCKLFYKDYGIEMNIGYKNFCIQDLNIPYQYSFTISINPFKKFEPQL